MLRRLRDIAIYFIAVLVGCGLALSVVFGFGALVDSVQAAAPTGGAENGCVEIGTIGTVTVGRCIDPDTDTVIYGNSVGWMDVAE